MVKSIVCNLPTAQRQLPRLPVANIKNRNTCLYNCKSFVTDSIEQEHDGGITFFVMQKAEKISGWKKGAAQGPVIAVVPVTRGKRGRQAAPGDLRVDPREGDAGVVWGKRRREDAPAMPRWAWLSGSA
jgi:hypothetical protein